MASQQEELPIRPHAAYWLVAIPLGILPNVLLVGCGGLIGVVAFNGSVQYAARSTASEFLLVAAALLASGTLNLASLIRGATCNEPALYRAALVASGGLVLWAVARWQASVAVHGALAEAGFLGVSGILSLAAHLCSPRRGGR